MASIIKRKSKYSVVYYYTDEKGEKRQKWETCQDYAEAKRRKAEIENQQNHTIKITVCLPLFYIFDTLHKIPCFFYVELTAHNFIYGCNQPVFFKRLYNEILSVIHLSASHLFIRISKNIVTYFYNIYHSFLNIFEITVILFFNSFGNYNKSAIFRLICACR